MKNNATKQKVKIVLFSGGRGTSIISSYLLDRLDISLTVAVNAYDDGLSTGRLRNFIPGMLGPSDIRKNISSLMDIGDDSQKNLKFILEYRFSENVNNEDVLSCLHGIVAIDPEQCIFPELMKAISYLKFNTFKKISEYLQKFIDYFYTQKNINVDFDFKDCSLGNIIFSGIYLLYGNDFNKACTKMCEFCSCRAEVMNVSKGENLVLTAIKEDLTYLSRESEIVSKHSTQSSILELFLLPDYLDNDKLIFLKNLKTASEKINFLRDIEKFPAINPNLAQRLCDADMIIYGPGTQHSSLLPSYLTMGLSESISINKDADKIFICNISKDNDIEMESVDSILNKFAFYASRKGKIFELGKNLSPLISHAFIQKNNGNEKSFLHYFRTESFHGAVRDTHSISDRLKIGRGLNEIYVRDWEDKPGKHHGFLVEREIVAILERKKRLIENKNGSSLLSIVIPALNEAHSVERVLRELQAEDFSKKGIYKEVILVDGGSSDGTADIAENIEGIKVIRLPVASGYGAALLAGFEAARGEIVATFPADGEYLSSELLNAVALVKEGNAEVCFGSRIIKCLNLDNILLKIYSGRKIPYLLSKYGGFSISIASFLRCGQFLSDPLTQFRVFKYEFMKNLKLSRSDFCIISEIIAKSRNNKQYIIEVPVTYLPRQKSDGKKMNVKTGIKILFSLIFSKF